MKSSLQIKNQMTLVKNMYITIGTILNKVGVHYGWMM